MSIDTSTNSQISNTDSTNETKTDEQKVDQAADKMANKGISLEHKHEGARTPGGVSGVDGGLFTK